MRNMTLLIKNVRLLSGRTEASELQNVLIRGERISAIGKIPEKRGQGVIDGKGGYLTPGFIDIDTMSDHDLSLFSHPAHENLVSQGVTTAIMGTCGSSLAPLIDGRLDAIRKWGDIRAENVSWRTTKEFLSLLGDKHLGINVGTYTGYATIRRALVGNSTRPLTKKELDACMYSIETSLRVGSLGLSCGLSYAHGKGVTYSELRQLGEVVGKEKGILLVHARKEKGKVIEEAREAIKLARETGTPTVLNHFLPDLTEGKEYEQALEEIESAGKYTPVYISVSPWNTVLRPLYTILPTWAKDATIELMAEKVLDDWRGKKILRELPRLGADACAVVRAPGHAWLEGKSLRELKDLFSKKTLAETILQLMRLTQLRATIVEHRKSDVLLTRAMQSSRSLIASHAPSLPKHGTVLENILPHAYQTFTKFLALAEKEAILGREAALSKLTQKPAELLGLTERGSVQEGNRADLVLVRDGRVEEVVLGGTHTLEGGVLIRIGKGEVIKHKKRP